MPWKSLETLQLCSRCKFVINDVSSSCVTTISSGWFLFMCDIYFSKNWFIFGLLSVKKTIFKNRYFQQWGFLLAYLDSCSFLECWKLHHMIFSTIQQLIDKIFFITIFVSSKKVRNPFLWLYKNVGKCIGNPWKRLKSRVVHRKRP